MQKLIESNTQFHIDQYIAQQLYPGSQAREAKPLLLQIKDSMLKVRQTQQPREWPKLKKQRFSPTTAQDHYIRILNQSGRTSIYPFLKCIVALLH